MDPIDALESFIDKFERSGAATWTDGQSAKVETYDGREYELPPDVIREGFEACLDYLENLGALTDEDGESDTEGSWLEIYIR